MNPENQGPEIGLWLNDHSFVSGDKAGVSPILLADLFDTNGINSFGLGIGHEIEAVVDNDRPHSMVLDNYFTPVFDTYTRGSIVYPLTGLASGNHTLSLKAWDMFDNSSEKQISFYIPANPALTVQNVMNAPNPMADFTLFKFQPHQVDFGGVDVTIRVFNLSGQQVSIITAGFSESAAEAGNIVIPWNGTDSNGRKLPNGLYPYKISFSGRNGGYSETSQKLMILR